MTGRPTDKVKKRPGKALIPYAQNSRTHSVGQVAQIAESIKAFSVTTAFDTEQLYRRVFAALDELAASDARAGHCAAWLRGTRQPGGMGRPPIDDSDALAEVSRHQQAGRRREAVSMVAARMTDDPHERDSIARRLRDKLRKMKRR